MANATLKTVNKELLDCLMSNKVKIIFICLFLLGSGIRAVDVWRPVDGSVRNSWRECDIASIARNYVHEGMNLLYPRIDWRGDGPGFTEMEFPLYPWTIAVLYKIFGFHEVIGRFISYAFSLLAMVVFFRFTRYLMPDLGAIVASTFFVLSPLVVRISNSLQPEGLMFLCYVLAVYSFVRWIDEDSRKYYWIAMFATSLAILAKANAAHIGSFFAVVILTHEGFGVLRRARIWIFAFVSLFPAALWYIHAHNLWLKYGNSLGVSNEYHWVGWDFFTDPSFILGISRLEILYVWMPTGMLIMGFGVISRANRKEVRYGLYWLCAIFLYYLIAARTTRDTWAVYYHVVSVPPVAILMGAGVEAIYPFTKHFKKNIESIITPVVATTILTLTGILIQSKLMILSVFMGFSIIMVIIFFPNYVGDDNPTSDGGQFNLLYKMVIYFSAICLSATFLFQIRQVSYDIHPDQMKEKYECALNFASDIPKNSLIVASGGTCMDDTGYPVAYNASYFFYWLDRKGFNICLQEQSIDALKSLANRGARYFVAEKSALKTKPGFEHDLRGEFKLLQECPEAFLFELTST